MADEEMNYFAKFSLDASSFIGGIQQSQQGFLSFYRDVTVSLQMTMMIFDKFMQYGQKFVDLANKAMEFQSSIDKLSITMGVSTEDMYKWANVARYADSDISSLAAILRKLSINMTETGAAGDKARDMLDAMHVSIKNADGSTRSMSDIFPDVIEGLKGIEDAGTRNTVAMALFGRSYQELAGYMLMNKDELKGYFDKGFAPSAAQQQSLRDYEQATKDLNKSMSDLGTTIGIAITPNLIEIVSVIKDDLIPAMRDIADIAGGLGLSDGLHLFVDMIDDAANGAQILRLALDANITNYGEFYGKLEALQLDHMARKAARDDAFEWAQMAASGSMGETNFHGAMDAYFAWKEGKTGSGFTIPGGGDNKNALTESEIAEKQNQLAIKKLDVKDSQREYNDLLKHTNDWQTIGCKTQDEFNEKLERSRLKMVGLQNDVTKLTGELTKAGVAASGVTGGQTYNQQFAASLDFGRVGPDTAGFSDLANMTPDQLKKMAAGDFSLTGGSKAMAEKAQTYLDLMKKGGGAATTTGAGTTGTTSAAGAPTSKKTLSLADQATVDTKTIQTELEKQAGFYTKLNVTVYDGWVELNAACKIKDIAEAESGRVKHQALLGYAAETKNWIGANPIIQKMVVLSKYGYDIDPSPFPAVTAPTLVAADFSGVQFLQSKEQNSNSETKKQEEATESKTVSITVNQVNNGVKTDADGLQKAIGGIIALGGALP